MAVSEKTWFERVEKAGVKKTYAPQDVIHFQGEEVTHICLVMSGTAEAISFSESGAEIWIGQYQTGDFFGQLSFLSGTPSQYELVAKTDLNILQITAQDMTRLIHSDEALNLDFTQDTARRLEALTLNLVDAYALSAKGRICAELLRISHEIGIDPGKHIIRPNPICVELARRVNSTRETVSRTISELQKMGVLSREPGALIVQSPEQLRVAFQ